MGISKTVGGLVIEKQNWEAIIFNCFQLLYFEIFSNDLQLLKNISQIILGQKLFSCFSWKEIWILILSFTSLRVQYVFVTYVCPWFMYPFFVIPNRFCSLFWRHLQDLYNNVLCDSYYKYRTYSVSELQFFEKPVLIVEIFWKFSLVNRYL